MKKSFLLCLTFVVLLALVLTMGVLAEESDAASVPEGWQTVLIGGRETHILVENGRVVKRHVAEYQAKPLIPTETIFPDENVHKVACVANDGECGIWHEQAHKIEWSSVPFDADCMRDTDILKIANCTICGAKIYDQQYASKKVGHSFENSEWMVTKPATCGVDGEETRTCMVCSVTETRTIPMLNHSYTSCFIRERDWWGLSYTIEGIYCVNCEDFKLKVRWTDAETQEINTLDIPLGKHSQEEIMAWLKGFE